MPFSYDAKRLAQHWTMQCTIDTSVDHCHAPLKACICDEE